MSCLRRSIVAFAFALACTMILHPLQAQTRSYSNVVQLNVGGGYLGVHMKDVTSEDVSKYKLSSERGVIVSSVAKESPAEAANLKEGDVILEFGGFAVWSSRQFARLVEETPVGRKVDLVVSRDGNRLNLNATIKERDRGTSARSMEPFPDDWFGPGQRSFGFRLPDMPDRPDAESAPQKARLGVTIQPLTDQLGEFLGVPGKKGVLVASVMEGSPSVGKLRSGDVITSVDGKAIDSPEELSRLVRASSGGEVKLKVIRDKKEISVAVALPASDDKGYKL